MFSLMNRSERQTIRSHTQPQFTSTWIDPSLDCNQSCTLHVCFCQQTLKISNNSTVYSAASSTLIHPLATMFSTHLGQYAPRPARSVPIVLRSSPEDDQESMVTRFRKLFPAECKAITIPVKNIHRWFDPYDLNRHGAEFLRSVLTTIAKENSLRAQKIAKFADDWRRNNPTLFNALTSQSQDIFTAEEVKEHDSEFLAEVYQKIIFLRSKNAVQCMGSTRILSFGSY